jgi:hypothetical protein
MSVTFNRPSDISWDDDLDGKLLNESWTVWHEYDSNLQRKCIDCLCNRVGDDGIRCLSCDYKRKRRMAIKR